MLYRQLVYLSTHKLAYGYRHMNSCDTIRNVTGCPAQCNIEEGLAASWKAVFGRDISQQRDMPIYYATGAIFAATRENIRLHPKSFYENMLTLYKEDSLGHRSEAIYHLGYALEVMWGRIFSGESVDAGNLAERVVSDHRFGSSICRLPGSEENDAAPDEELCHGEHKHVVDTSGEYFQLDRECALTKKLKGLGVLDTQICPHSDMLSRACSAGDAGRAAKRALLDAKLETQRLAGEVLRARLEAAHR